MNYISTRGHSQPTTAAQAVVDGIAPDGGLYVPTEVIPFSAQQLQALAGEPYHNIALAVMRRFFAGIDDAALQQCVHRAWGPNSGFAGQVAPLVRVGDAHVMELWHGPTSAFKDVALQFLPRLLSQARAQLGMREGTLILVATSGDTGKAALAGFADVPGTRICAFYPHGGVSTIQRRQMTTQRGDNVCAMGVYGNFDDVQTGVKQIFTDPDYAAALRARGWQLSSANSINWGRLAPQVAYYVAAWCRLYADGQVAPGEPVDFVVPTGNFGNILAGWYARRLGVPVGRLVCASNANRVLTDFFEQGLYDARRTLQRTLSPSMDILVSSNLERLLFEAGGRDAAFVRDCMAQLAQAGVYRVPQQLLAELRTGFAAGSADDAVTRRVIRAVYERYGYMLDPHTAVAWDVYERMRAQGGLSARQCVVLATAHPCKFAHDVLEALGGARMADERAALAALAAYPGVEVPPSIAELWALPERHTGVCERAQMPGAVLTSLG